MVKVVAVHKKLASNHSARPVSKQVVAFGDQVVLKRPVVASASGDQVVLKSQPVLQPLAKYIQSQMLQKQDRSARIVLNCTEKGCIAALTIVMN